VVKRSLWHWLAFTTAWIVASVVGSAPLLWPSVVASQVTLILSISPYGFIVAAIAIATWLAVCQYVVLRAALGRESMAAISWIPATVLAVVAAVCFTAIWQTTVPRTLISISAIQASLPPGFPLIEVIMGLFVLPLAAFLGVIQGVALSTIFGRNVVGLWLLANLFTGLIVGTVQGLTYHQIVNSIYSDPSEYLVLGTLLSGILYAAVTGPALLAIAEVIQPKTPRHGAAGFSDDGQQVSTSPTG
jgi:hypothetical protein